MDANDKDFTHLVIKRLESIEQTLEKIMKGDSHVSGSSILDNQDLCILLKVSKRTLQRYRSSGKLQFRRIGQKTYYLQCDVDDFIKSNFNKGGL